MGTDVQMVREKIAHSSGIVNNNVRFGLNAGDRTPVVVVIIE